MDSSSETYDCIVVGLGAHGSCACARLAKNGAKVLGIEQFEDVTHCNGSSHGKSRIIRTAYFESPKYVPLVQRSLALWKESQQEYVDLQRAECTSIADADNINPNPLLVLSGCLIIGKKSTTIVKGTLASARAHKLKYEVLSASEIRTRYNGIFNVDVEDIGVFEPDCGYLIPEACIAAHIRLAQQHRAVTRYGERMLSWEEVFEGEDGDSSPIIIVTTDKGKYRAHKLVLSVGAWAPEIYGHRIVDCMRLQCERRLLWWLDPLRSPTTLGTAETANSSSGKDSSDLSYDNSSTNGTLAIRADNVLLYWAQLVFRWGVNWSQSWWRWLFLPGVKSLQNDETRSSAGSCAFVTQVQARQTQSMIDTCTRLPVYIWDTGTGNNFYGFPYIENAINSDSDGDALSSDPIARFSGTGVKMAMHYSPEKEDVRCERSTIDRVVGPKDENNMRSLVSVYMPAFNGPVVNSAVCMYTSTPDGHFLLDWLPSLTAGRPPNVLLCSPCSGHGFKMASVVGEIVQQLVQTGKTEHDISLFKLKARTC